MKYKNLIEEYNKVIDFVGRRRLKETFDILKRLAVQCKNIDLINQTENYYQVYSNMLKYSFELTDDPEKENVYKHLVKSILELADDIKEDIIINSGILNYYKEKTEFSDLNAITESDSEEIVENLQFSHEIEKILDSVTDTAIDDKDYKFNINRLFKYIWLSDKLKEAEIHLVQTIRTSKSIPWYDKSVLVSALTLSLFRHFDSKKVMLLIDFYESGENQVWQRAFVGVVLSLYYYDDRLMYYPDIINRLKSMQGNKALMKNLEAVIIQFVKAKETEKVTKKIREEILPEVLKIKSRLEEKLDINSIISGKSFEEKNPEWENFFKDSPDVYNKFEEFSNMQSEGADVFLSAFAMLKRFDFFNDIVNWFIPFYKENKIISNSLGIIKDSVDIKEFTEGLERTTFMCNSDKYSFCLNINYLPDEQKSMMTELFNTELKAMNEMAEENSSLNNSESKAVITQYLQDLYRFHKLYPFKEEFTDIFDLNFSIYKANFFHILINDKIILRNIAELFFEKNYYLEALDLFLDCSLSEDNYEVFEKIAYCFQQTGDLHNALIYYHKAEIIDKNKVWILQRIAWCYRKLKNYDKSLQYYKEVEKLKPDDLEIQVMLGQVYMDLENYEEALKYFFKVEYLSPDNYKVLRPLGWCSFVLGKLETARKYTEKLISREANKNDYMNMGHIEWAEGNKLKSIENYRNAIIKSNNDLNWFSKSFEEDKKYLIKNGIAVFDIPLMIDYLKIFANN